MGVCTLPTPTETLTTASRRSAAVRTVRGFGLQSEAVPKAGRPCHQWEAVLTAGRLDHRSGADRTAPGFCLQWEAVPTAGRFDHRSEADPKQCWKRHEQSLRPRAALGQILCKL
jgi:hypothetical protein